MHPRVLVLCWFVQLLSQQGWNTLLVFGMSPWYDVHQTEEFYCGIDENGTQVREPLDWVPCDDPHGFKSAPESGDYTGTLFRGTPGSGRIVGHVSYYQISHKYIGYACDGVLLFDTWYKIRRPENVSRGSRPNMAAEQVQTHGEYGFGHYGYPSVLGMRCLVNPLVNFDDDNPNLFSVKHGTISQCTICDEKSPFDCPTEFEHWYLDAELTYREGTICDEKSNSSSKPSDRIWFHYVDTYYDPTIDIFLAQSSYSSLGRRHPFMPGVLCSDGNCTCSLEGPVYPDHLFGGENPTWSLPITLKGYTHHGRTLGQILVGDCDHVVVQSVFKIDSDSSWGKNISVEYGGINATNMVDLEDLRKNHLTPGLYVPTTEILKEPQIPNYAGLLNPHLFKYPEDNVTLIRCLIEPSDQWGNEKGTYAQGTPYGCIQCWSLSPCATPRIKNGSSTWILDTVRNLNPMTFVPGIHVPPGYNLTLLVYNASSESSWISSHPLPAPVNATNLNNDHDRHWIPVQIME